MEATPAPNPQKYSTWKAIFLSLFSGDLYRDVARNWKGVGFGYLFLILLLGWIPAAIKMHLAVSKELQAHSVDAFKGIPDFKIEDGEFSIKVKQPFFYYEPKAKTPSIIIDTTGRIKSLSQIPGAAKMPQVMLITKTELITHRDRLGVPEDQTVKFSQFGPLSLDKNDLIALYNFVGRWVGLIIYPFAVGGHFVYNMIAVLVYGLIGMILAKILNAPLKYETLMRLAAVSHTPGLLLALVLFLAGVTLPFSFWLFLLLSTAFLFRAILATKVNPPTVPT